MRQRSDEVSSGNVVIEGMVPVAAQPSTNRTASCRQCEGVYELPPLTQRTDSSGLCPFCRTGRLNPDSPLATRTVRTIGPNFAMQVVGGLRKPSKKILDPATAVNQVVEKFGGIDEFATTLANQIREAAINRPGSPSTIRAMQDVLKMMVSVKRIETEEETAIASRLSDEQLKQAIVDAVIDEIEGGNDGLIDTLSSALRGKGKGIVHG